MPIPGPGWAGEHGGMAGGYLATARDQTMKETTTRRSH
jgi:hypothetical protein